MLACCTTVLLAAWVPAQPRGSRPGSPRTSAPRLLQGYQNGCNPSIETSRTSLDAALRRGELTAELLRACAAAGRGFGASTDDRARVDALIAELEPMSPCETPTAGLDGGLDGGRWMGRGYDHRYDTEEDSMLGDGFVAPLAGRWRLVYTSASDVLSLDASPVAGVGAIFQEIAPPSSVTNVITLYPRLAALLPPGTLDTKTRLRVGTRARARDAKRVGLTFENVGVEPRSLLGLSLSALPPLSLPLPRLPGTGGADSESSSAYFDVSYLDDTLLIIRQNEPGGVFVSLRDDAE